MTPQEIDPISLVPQMTGRNIRAWRQDLATGYTSYDVPEDCRDVIACWVIEAPDAHPVWHSYSLAMMRLDLILNPIRYLRGATHEMQLQALDPRFPREPMIRGAEQGAFLSPMNFAAQLIKPSHEAAIAVLDDAVARICAGTLSPDTDDIRQWLTLYGDNCVALESRDSPSMVLN
ncbi:hypothetical protein [Hyphomicrobium sp.]|uniref:hypothetical protein n=1 Tax=Hyphomicrobium sp. TaxID=82 RepID=UPI001D938C3B|nr:hypothetical protein [Hyphomicrobium sp.]MBY0559915.1 hypothetical protein [Hyphomicrobium sp.]